MAFRKRVYDVKGFVSDAAALLPRLAEIKAIQSGSSIEPALREEIMVTVARANECRYCIFAHETAAREVGVTEHTLGSLAAGRLETADPERGSALSLAYARALAESRFGPVDPALEAEIVAVHGDDHRRLVETTARVMSVMNLAGNTVDALLSRLGGDPAPDSRLCDEIALTGLWLGGAALTSLNLMRARHEGPLSLLGAFLAFSSGLESTGLPVPAARET